MLQIPQKIDVNHSRSLAAYLPQNRYKPCVAASEQQVFLQHLTETIRQECFHFSINLVENKIAHCRGVAHWLGYADTDFSLKNYREIIHPTHASLQGYYSMALMELLMHGAIRLQFLRPVWVTLITLKHKTGKYIYCKRECAPFQFTDDNKLTEYLCLFTIIKEFNNESYHTRIYPANTQNRLMNEKLLALVRKKFADHTGFSVQELRILKRYAYQKHSTSEIIANAFKIKRSTVNTFNKRILKKTETFSQQHFNTAKEAALYFKHAGLI